ncbi:MAG: RNA pyrophosphohydrolase [Hyphomicrobiales bacterium]|nr:RNA pyrophosphohydrolase [Hyphomicrobiales bacterium]
MSHSSNTRKPSKLPYRKGVGAVLINGDGKVFVAKRIDTPGEAWQMPQGGLDDGEKPRKAVIRELREEIGTDKVEIIAKSRTWIKYDLPDHLLGRVWKGRYRGQKQRWFLMRFLGEDGDIDLDASSHPEFDAWRWVDFHALPDLIVPFKRQLYEDIVQEFSDAVLPLGGPLGGDAE